MSDTRARHLLDDAREQQISRAVGQSIDADIQTTVQGHRMVLSRAYGPCVDSSMACVTLRLSPGSPPGFDIKNYMIVVPTPRYCYAGKSPLNGCLQMVWAIDKQPHAKRVMWSDPRWPDEYRWQA